MNGDDLRRHPWDIRRATLTQFVRKAPNGIRLSEDLAGCGDTIYRHACGLGAEGIVTTIEKRPHVAFRVGQPTREIVST
jgi:bifunctional non-homologous end joining protein LigD